MTSLKKKHVYKWYIDGLNIQTLMVAGEVS